MKKWFRFSYFIESTLFFALPTAILSFAIVPRNGSIKIQLFKFIFNAIIFGALTMLSTLMDVKKQSKKFNEIRKSISEFDNIIVEGPAQQL